MLKQRVITALILAPLVLSGLFLLEPLAFSWFVGAIVFIAAWEWANLAGIENQPGRLLYAAIISAILFVIRDVPHQPVLILGFCWWVCAVYLVLAYPNKASIWHSAASRCVIGGLVLVPFWKALVFVRSAEILPMADLSMLWVILYVLLLVWAADIGAYFAGKRWGKSKLAPKVSPGKSWAGAWGGLAATVVLALIASLTLSLSMSAGVQLAIASALAGAISIVGDLTESMFKRHRGIKDSSQLLPGHGGVLDRIDSLTAAVPVFAVFLMMLGWL